MKDLHLNCFSNAVCVLFDTQTLTSPFSCVFSITMSGLQGLAQENIWFDKSRYDEAERCFYEGNNGIPQTSQVLPPTDPDVRARYNSRV